MQQTFSPLTRLDVYRGILIGIIATVAAFVLGGFIWISFAGLYMGADVKPGNVERQLANYTRDRAIAVYSPSHTEPPAPDPAVLQQGQHLYKQNCDMCHGDSQHAGPLHNAVYPKAPPLLLKPPDDPDSRIYWVIDHGIRFTGMPAWGHQLNSDQIWSIVVFLKHAGNSEQSSKKAS